MKLTLSVLRGVYTIIKLGPNEAVPNWLTIGQCSLVSITKTKEELSIVCDQAIVPNDIQTRVNDWKVFKVEGPLDFSLTGILSSLAQPLAEQKISIFAISTYDTDYILVKEQDLKNAIHTLSKQCIIKNNGAES